MKMLRFEIKKVFSKMINKIVLAALFIVTLAAAMLAIRDVRYVKEDGKEVVTGYSAAKELRKRKNEWKGELNGAVLRKVIEENQAINAAEKDDDAAFAKKQGFIDIKNMFNSAFGKFDEYDYYLVDRISKEEADEFYQRRISGLKEYLNSEEIKNGFTDAEKDFLISQYERLETPFYYAYADGWKAILDSHYLPTLMIFVVVLTGFMTAGIFSDEFQYKADAIFFSAKYGRNKAITAKIQAGFTIVSVVYWGSMLLYSALILLTLGTGGAHCPVQTGLGNWKSIYNITYIQDFFFSLLGGYIGTLFILTLAMLISVKLRSTVIAATIPFVLACIPMFLGRISILAPISIFSPDQLLRISVNLEEFVVVTIGGKAMGYISFLIPLYFVLSCVLIPMIYKGYKKAEVK